MSKAAFILAQRPDTSAAEIVAKAAKIGLEFSIAYVYTARSNASRRKVAGPKARPRATRSGNVDAAAAVRRLIADLGLTRARAVLRDVIATFGAT